MVISLLLFTHYVADQLIISEFCIYSATLLQRVFLSLNLYETLSYEGVLVSPELVHNVLPFIQYEGKVPEETRRSEDLDTLCCALCCVLHRKDSTHLMEKTQTLFLQVP